VDRAAKPLTTRDTLLLITHAAGDEVEGRTVMQKLAYFCGLELGAGLGYYPHYFGPFSSKVEDALSNAVIAGELDEDVDRLPDWRGGADVLKFTYRLDDAGQGRVERLIADHPKEWEAINRSVSSIREVLPKLDQKTLSSAAKTYLIISESEEGVDQEDIPKLARRLGWSLSPAQVARTVALLDQLGLVDEDEDDD
jgi:uncharacterized protein YwgA